MSIILKSWKTGETIHECDVDTMLECLEDCAANGVIVNFGDLRGANLSGANLSGLKSFGSKFTCANLDDSVLDGAEFNGCDFSSAKIDAKSMKLVKFNICNMLYAKMPIGSCIIAAGPAYPVFLSSDSVCVGSFKPLSAIEYLTKSDDEITEFGGESLLSFMPYLRKLIRFQLF